MPRRGTAAPLLPLSAVVALTPTQLLANFPAILRTVQHHHLLQPPPVTSATAFTSASAPVSSHTRLLTKCLGLISQGQRASNPPEQWCGLQLLRALVRQSPSDALAPHYRQISGVLAELQKQSGHAGDVLDLPLLECVAAVLSSLADADGEVRRDVVAAHLSKTVNTAIDRLGELLATATAVSPDAVSSGASLRRLLAVLDELLSTYVTSLRSFSSRLQPLLSALLLHCDDSCLPPLLSCLTTLLVSTSAAAASQLTSKAKQARMQQAAQDTADEVAQDRLVTPAASPAHTASPYHAFAAACLSDMRAAVNELRAAMGEQVVLNGGVASAGLGWGDVRGAGMLRGLEVVRRYERACAMMAALVAPRLPPAVASSAVELSVPLLPLLHVLFAALAVEPYASSSSSGADTALTPTAALAVLPSLYESSLRLLDSLLRHCHHALLRFLHPLALLLVDVHRRCSSTPACEHLLPAVYLTLASLFRLPLSPSLLATLSGTFVSSLLAHVQQPFVLRREQSAQQASQSMAAHLKPAAAKDRRKSSTSAASAASTALLGKQQVVKEDAAASALLCLHALLEAGSLLPLAARTSVDSALLLLCMSLASSASSASPPLPASIRTSLYRCLLSALTHPPAASPSTFVSPLLPYALPVLSRAAASAHGEEEAAVCREGLLLCEWLTRERAGVAAGRRRMADRVFDRTEGAEDEEAHVLDSLDEWSASAAATGEAHSGSKRQRAEEEKDEQAARRRVAHVLAGSRSEVEQKEGAQQMELAEDELEVSEPAAEQKSGAGRGWQDEQKHAAGGGVVEEEEEAEEAEEDEEPEEEEQSEGEEQDDARTEPEKGREEKEEQRAGKTAIVATSTSSSRGTDDADDDEFGAVLHVDDDDEDEG